MISIDSTMLDMYKQAMGDEGDDFVKDIVKTFIDDSQRIEKELKAALNEMVSPNFQRAAHSLKSNCATVGATETSEKFKELEGKGATGDINGIDLSPILKELEEVRKKLAEIYL